MNKVTYWLSRLFDPLASNRFDSALIVSVLASYGECSTLDIRHRMEDRTRGAWNWALRSDARIHRLLDQLEAEGTVISRENSYGREYRLRASSEKLLRVV